MAKPITGLDVVSNSSYASINFFYFRFKTECKLKNAP